MVQADTDDLDDGDFIWANATLIMVMTKLTKTINFMLCKLLESKTYTCVNLRYAVAFKLHYAHSGTPESKESFAKRPRY